MELFNANKTTHSTSRPFFKQDESPAPVEHELISLEPASWIAGGHPYRSSSVSYGMRLNQNRSQFGAGKSRYRRSDRSSPAVCSLVPTTTDRHSQRVNRIGQLAFIVPSSAGVVLMKRAAFVTTNLFSEHRVLAIPLRNDPNAAPIREQRGRPLCTPTRRREARRWLRRAKDYQARSRRVAARSSC